MDSNDFSKVLEDLAYIYENAEEFTDFISRNNIGVPAAYLLHRGLVTNVTDRCKSWIMESWQELQNSGIVFEDA